MTAQLTIRKPDDFHVHLRTGEMMRTVLPFTHQQFQRALVMPNTIPPILTAEQAFFYEGPIVSLSRNTGFQALMTIQINAQTTPAIVAEAKIFGAVAGKLYPQGVTTNSQNGVSDFRKLYPVFEKMQEVGMVLSVHGEDPDKKISCLQREEMFLPTLYGIATDFPKLKIVLEHISTEAAVKFIYNVANNNVCATITAHHLVLTLDDIIGDLLRPHNFCKPVAKFPCDRQSLLNAATIGNHKFFFGSDSAPHPISKKECACGCAGCFTAPVAMPLLAQIFEEQNALDKLEDFTSKFGAQFYGLPQNTGTITLVKEDWVVPQNYDGIVPFMAGETLHWKLAE